MCLYVKMHLIVGFRPVKQHVLINEYNYVLKSKMHVMQNYAIDVVHVKKQMSYCCDCIPTPTHPPPRKREREEKREVEEHILFGFYDNIIFYVNNNYFNCKYRL